MLLWILLALALGFAVWQPRSPQATMALVDWQTIGALAGLLAITQAVERSGMLQATAQRLLTRVSTLRGLALLLTATAALLSALVIKASLFVLWRVFSQLAPTTSFAPVIATAVGAAGAVGVVWGGILALRRDRLKTIVAYSTVAQVGYLVLLLPLLSTAGGEAAWSGGIVLAVAHGLAKAAMFLAAGALAIAYGGDRIDGLHGALSRMPLAVATIGVAGVSLAGLPPALGFVGKWQLLQGALAADAWWWVAVLLVGGLLTFAYTGRMIAAMFNVPGEDPPPPRTTPGRALSIVPFALAAASLVLGLFPAPLADLLAGTLTGGGGS